VDLHTQAFALAEELSLPVMVCMDGFVLTHAFERVDLPTQEQVDAFLPPYEPRQVLDPDDPASIGAMVGPEAFTEVRYLAHARHLDALERIPRLSAAFATAFGRDSGGLVRPYRTDDAETVVLALGSVLGTIKDVVDELRDQGKHIGVVGLTTFRPFPLAAVREALGRVRRVVVLERAFSLGVGGVVSADVRTALAGTGGEVFTVVAGLGGRPITKASLHRLLDGGGELEPLTFLDLDQELVDRELARAARQRRSGPSAENILRDLAGGG
jgi:pyruvate ferredoxin oxidoreductase alpha subunit